MKKTTAFLLSCFIYFTLISLFILACSVFNIEKKSVNFGNSEIDILFVENETEEQSEIKQDYTKELGKINNENKINKDIENVSSKEEVKEVKQIEEVKQAEEIKQAEEVKLDDLFSDLNIQKPPQEIKEQKTKEKNKLSEEQLEKLKSIRDKFANTTVKSNNNNKSNNKTSPQAKGMYDEYLGRVNAYLKNKWSLVTANANGISDKEFFEISFKISKDGIIKIQDYDFAENTILRKKAKEFIILVNRENKNLGIPPKQKEYDGLLRLSVILNIKEIR